MGGWIEADRMEATADERPGESGEEVVGHGWASNCSSPLSANALNFDGFRALLLTWC